MSNVITASAASRRFASPLCPCAPVPLVVPAHPPPANPRFPAVVIGDPASLVRGYRVSGADTDFAPIISGAVTGTHPPADTAAIQTRWLKEARGAAFRSERYPEFAQHEQQAAAAKTVIDRGFEVVVAMGGNGTMEGIKALSRRLIDAGASEVRCFFVPVTIDGDVSGTDSIGQATAVEVGSERIRRFVADADTHQRCYVIEMMGSKSGCHALHSSIGGGGHYAVACEVASLPSLSSLSSLSPSLSSLSPLSLSLLSRSLDLSWLGV